MTRGCIPYPTIEPQKILTFIETEGKRMEKPDHAPVKVQCSGKTVLKHLFRFMKL